MNQAATKIPAYLWKAMGIPYPKIEYVFCTGRKFRFDFAWPEYRLAVEIEGGAYTNGRHRRIAGFLSDMEKYNLATVQGWKLLRYVPGKIGFAQIQHCIAMAQKG